MKMNSFAVFILSHGRANNVITVETLRRCGYTGKIYIIIDDEDDQEEEYRSIYGDSVIQFSKKEMDGSFDIGDNFDDRRVVIYARNKCHDIASDLQLDYFLVLDDDYDDFSFRYDDNGSLRRIRCRSLDKLFASILDFLEVSGAVTVAFAQGGDYIGGVGSRVWKEKLTRKAMNTFFCKTDRPFQFYGRINEDTTCYVVLGQRGKLFFTIGDVMVNQLQTQSNAGGLTDIYLDKGTYYKSFCSVMFAPSCVKVSSMGNKYKRIHHRVQWKYCTPMILNEKWKKVSKSK